MPQANLRKSNAAITAAVILATSVAVGVPASSAEFAEKTLGTIIASNGELLFEHNANAYEFICNTAGTLLRADWDLYEARPGYAGELREVQFGLQVTSLSTDMVAEPSHTEAFGETADRSSTSLTAPAFALPPGFPGDMYDVRLTAKFWDDLASGDPPAEAESEPFVIVYIDCSAPPRLDCYVDLYGDGNVGAVDVPSAQFTTIEPALLPGTPGIPLNMELLHNDEILDHFVSLTALENAIAMTCTAGAYGFSAQACPVTVGVPPPDADKDCVPDADDNCPSTPNTSQKDSDAADGWDTEGDACDPDDDNDWLADKWEARHATARLNRNQDGDIADGSTDEQRDGKDGNLAGPEVDLIIKLKSYTAGDGCDFSNRPETFINGQVIFKVPGRANENTVLMTPEPWTYNYWHHSTLRDPTDQERQESFYLKNANAADLEYNLVTDDPLSYVAGTTTIKINLGIPLADYDWPDPDDAITVTEPTPVDLAVDPPGGLQSLLLSGAGAEAGCWTSMEFTVEEHISHWLIEAMFANRIKIPGDAPFGA